MNICDYSDRLEIKRGQIVRVINAVPRSKKMRDRNLDVYREWENGKCECRNLYRGMCGYRVAFPKTVNSMYREGYLPFEAKLEKWGEIDKVGNFKWSSLIIDEKNTEVILSKYPDFKYVLKKWKSTIYTTMDALAVWKEHKEVEFLLAVGFERIALNRSFWKLGKEKQRQIVQFMRKHPECKNFSLGDVQSILKYKLTLEEFYEYDSWSTLYGKFSYDVYEYLRTKGCNQVWLYRDYARLLKQTTHNKNDPYWKFPKDLQAKHDELREEVARLEEVRQEEKLKTKQEKYLKAVRKLLKYKKVIDGYCIYVPDSVEEIKNQATALHQCLIACDYISKVIKHECVLVFIQKDGVPVATAELKKGNQIGQFYANELDRHDCLPSAEVKRAMKKWIKYKEAA